MQSTRDVRILRELAREYAEVAARPVQEQRRELWRRHLSLEPAGVPVLATYGMWNVWCRETFGDAAMQCADPFYRGYERHLRMGLFHETIGDDHIQEPWLTHGAVHARGWGGLWGVQEEQEPKPEDGGAWKYRPVIRDWDDLRKLSWPPHRIDEEATRTSLDRIREAVGDILPVDAARGAAASGFLADISTCLAKLRGLEQVMIDMYESPERLKELLAFMRDGILANQAAAEAAGDLRLTQHSNQCMPYCRELAPPRPNSEPVTRGQLWGFCAAQEFTLISPAMHDEFLYQYQMPIMRPYGLVAYGCCEDLTRKIDMLSQLPNLRIIAVAPRADLGRCAEQVGTRYVLSWRPNPTDMVCGHFDEARIRRILRAGLEAARGCRVHIHLKDIETVEGEPQRLANWVRLVRDVAAECA